MTKKPDTTTTPTKKDSHISKPDALVQGSNAELDEEDLKRVSGGSGIKIIKST